MSAVALQAIASRKLKEAREGVSTALKDWKSLREMLLKASAEAAVAITIPAEGEERIVEIGRTASGATFFTALDMRRYVQEFGRKSLDAAKRRLMETAAAHQREAAASREQLANLQTEEIAAVAAASKAQEEARQQSGKLLANLAEPPEVDVNDGLIVGLTVVSAVVGGGVLMALGGSGLVLTIAVLAIAMTPVAIRMFIWRSGRNAVRREASAILSAAGLQIRQMEAAWEATRQEQVPRLQQNLKKWEAGAAAVGRALESLMQGSKSLDLISALGGESSPQSSTPADRRQAPAPGKISGIASHRSNASRV